MFPDRILVALQGGDADQRPIETARKLAKHYNADVRGLFVEPDPSSYMLWSGPGAAGASVVSTALDVVRNEADKQCEIAEATFKTLVDQKTASFKRIVDSPSDSAQQARLVRLMVTCPNAAAGRGPLADFTTSCLVDEGCPIFVPRYGSLPPKRIAMAWDGSKEAARAAFAAEPLLKEGVKVRILHSSRNLDYHDRAASAPNRLANWLTPRGIEVETIELESSGSVGVAILEASSDCDLLVAGAYGHTRIAQFLFGGVTRTLLSTEDGPSLLIAH
jgi:nucleotide-binding universal stress UspA family protein